MCVVTYRRQRPTAGASAGLYCTRSAPGCVCVCVSYLAARAFLVRTFAHAHTCSQHVVEPRSIAHFLAQPQTCECWWRASQSCMLGVLRFNIRIRFNLNIRRRVLCVCVCVRIRERTHDQVLVHSTNSKQARRLFVCIAILLGKHRAHIEWDWRARSENVRTCLCKRDARM